MPRRQCCRSTGRHRTASAQASGERSSGLFAIFDPATCSWKMSQASFLGSDEYSETWPKSGSMRSGRAYERPMSARRTGESECLYWPTPRGLAENHGPDGNVFSTSIRRWSTPTAHDGRRPALDEHSKQGANLSRDVSIWPTPDANAMNDGESWESWESRRARLAEKGINGNGAGIPLAIAANHWATPKASDGIKPSAGVRTTSDLSHQAQAMPTDGEEFSRSGQTSRRRLNPRFVAWLMGLPPTWCEVEPTNCEHSVTESYLPKQQQRSENCGAESHDSLQRRIRLDHDKEEGE